MTEKLAHQAPEETPLDSVKPQASEAMRNELVALGFLADCDRDNPVAVARATGRLLQFGARLSKDVDALFASLREAKRRFDAQEDAGRRGALAALEAVNRYLMLFETVHTESLLTPLMILFNALDSLDGGQALPIVRAAKRHGRPPASALYNTLKGIAVFVAQRLVASGMRQAEARNAVAKRLVQTRLRPARKGSDKGSGDFTARTIKGWQEEIDADVGCETRAKQEFFICQVDQKRRVLSKCGLSSLPEGMTADDLELDSATPTEFRRAYLDVLAQFVRATRLRQNPLNPPT